MHFFVFYGWINTLINTLVLRHNLHVIDVLVYNIKYNCNTVQ